MLEIRIKFPRNRTPKLRSDLPSYLPMSSAFFTKVDGDIILRAGPESDSKHDFRVHKFILSLASPVFGDMFAFPQPPDQTLNEEQQLPVVDIPDPPEVMDVILRFVYPGVEPPPVTESSTLSALLLTADKYNITSIYPTLRENLKTFLPSLPLWVYILACRYGFPEEAKQAAEVTMAGSFLHLDDRENLRHIPSTDLFRLVQFVQERESKGRYQIQMLVDPSDFETSFGCEHLGQDAQDYYLHLEKAVEDAFVINPCVGYKDLFAVLDKIPDPPPGCKPHPKSAEWYCGGDDEDAFVCPLRPMTIRRMLVEVADELRRHNLAMLEKYFGDDIGNA